MTVIQWYPGHMAKALRQVKENLNAVDIVLELVDARLPESSRNPQLEELLQNKKSIIVLTKMDLADPKLTREWIAYYEQNGHPAIAVNSNQGTLPAIEKKIKEVLKEKIAAKEARGIKNSRIKAMCIGIPNVGKSTLLNRLVKKNVAIVGNKPGVTKAQQWLKAGSSLLLLDTPGILWPKFEDQQVGLKLALLGSVKDQVVNMDDLALFACEYLMQEKTEIFDTVYHVKIADTPYETLQNIAIKRGYLLKGEIDENRLMLSFVKDIRENKCGLITWEKPHVG